MRGLTKLVLLEETKNEVDSTILSKLNAYQLNVVNDKLMHDDTCTRNRIMFDKNRAVSWALTRLFGSGD